MLSIRRTPVTWSLAIPRSFWLPYGAAPYLIRGHGWVKPACTWGVRLGRWLYLLEWRGRPMPYAALPGEWDGPEPGR